MHAYQGLKQFRTLASSYPGSTSGGSIDLLHAILLTRRGTAGTLVYPEPLEGLFRHLP